MLNFLEKKYFLIILILLLAIFIRFYRLEENLIFHGELGDNYLQIKNYLMAKQLPLVGPPTSHPWLVFGPFYYWLMMLLFIFYKGDPATAAYFFALISVLFIFINFILIKRMFNLTISYISSLLFTISPLWIRYTRESRFYFLAAILSLFFYYFLFQLIKGRRKYFYWLGFVLGLMLNFHYSSLILIPAISMAFILFKISITKKDAYRTLVGLVLPNLPFAYYLIFKNREMIKLATMWIPYKILGFFHFFPNNQITLQSSKNNLLSLVDFLSWNFTVKSDFIFYILTVLFIILFLILINKLKKRNETLKMSSVVILFITFVSGFIILFLHQNPPQHYYAPLFPIPIILSAFIINYFYENKKKKIYFFLLAALFFLLALTSFQNFQYYFSSQWFYIPNDKLYPNKPVPYKLQKIIAKKIIDDAQSEKFNLKRIGSFDYYQGYYAQNYRYLLWLYGNEPKDEPTTLSYTIIEKTDSLSSISPNQKLIEVENIIIVKEIE